MAEMPNKYSENFGFFKNIKMLHDFFVVVLMPAVGYGAASD